MVKNLFLRFKSILMLFKFFNDIILYTSIYIYIYDIFFSFFLKYILNGDDHFQSRPPFTKLMVTYLLCLRIASRGES